MTEFFFRRPASWTIRTNGRVFIRELAQLRDFALYQICKRGRKAVCHVQLWHVERSAKWVLYDGFCSSLQAGVTQLVECNLAKVDVAGSNPVSRSNSPGIHLRPRNIPIN